MTPTRPRGLLSLELLGALGDSQLVLYFVFILAVQTEMTAMLFLLQGSIVGGFLAEPASKYSLFKVPFFCKFPYILPCLVGVAIGIMSFIGKSFVMFPLVY